MYSFNGRSTKQLYDGSFPGQEFLKIALNTSMLAVEIMGSLGFTCCSYQFDFRKEMLPNAEKLSLNQ